LVRELQDFTSLIDKKDEWCRELVWNQLFVITGCNKRHYSASFRPVLLDTLSCMDVKVLDIEVLFLSFLLAIKLVPNLFTCDTKPTILTDENKLEQLLLNNATQFFRSFLISIHSLIDDTSSSFTPINQSREKNIIQSDEKLQEIIKAIFLLEKWVNTLSSLPEEKRKLIHERSGNLSVLEDFVKQGSSFGSVIRSWTVTDITKNKDSIVALYNAIVELHETGLLDDKIFSKEMRENLSKDVETVPKPYIVTDWKKRSLPATTIKSFF